MQESFKLLHPELNPWKCPSHSQEVVTHLCCAKGCLVFLCSKCIKEHINIHKVKQTHAEIDTLEELQDECCGKVIATIIKFTNQRDELTKYSAQSITEDEEGIQRIRKTKMTLIGMIDKYFSDLEQKYVKFIKEEISVQAPLIAEYQKKNEKFIQKLDQLYLELQSKEPLDAIKFVVSHDIEDEYETFRNILQRELTLINVSSQQIQINNLELDAFHRNLEKIATFTPSPVKRQPFPQANAKVDSSLVLGTPRTTTTQTIIPSTQTPNTQTPKQLQSVLKSPSSQYGSKAHESNRSTVNISKSVTIIDGIVEEPDYFLGENRQKYLHFFQHKSNYLHIFDISKAQSSKVGFERIELNIDFKIPRWHRSLITPFSEIYLTGGVDCEDSEKKLNDAYVYDYSSQELIPIDPMKTRRSGHGLVYLDGYIYAIGGFSDAQDFTTKCERYDIQQNKWETIAALNLKANNPACCTFRNKVIYKFGGKLDDEQLNNTIERYDPMSDKWTMIDFELPTSFDGKKEAFEIYSSLACIQINPTQMMIFGGTHADYKVKSDECWILSVEADEAENGSRSSHREKTLRVGHKMRRFTHGRLPFAEGFWNSQVIVDDKKLYCLQNIPNEKNESIVYLDRRRVLVFGDDSRWKVLG